MRYRLVTRFHGVFAPNSKYRADVTPAKRGKGCAHQENEEKTPEQRHQSMTWAQRLKWVFNIDVSVCLKCEGGVKAIVRLGHRLAIRLINNTTHGDFPETSEGQQTPRPVPSMTGSR